MTIQPFVSSPKQTPETAYWPASSGNNACMSWSIAYRAGQFNEAFNVIGEKPPKMAPPKMFRLAPADFVLVGSFRLTIYRRSNQTATTALGSETGDSIIGTADFLVTPNTDGVHFASKGPELLSSPGNRYFGQWIDFAAPDLPDIYKGDIIGLELTAVDLGGAPVAFGMAMGVPAFGTAGIFSGMVKTAGTPGGVVVGNGLTVPLMVMEDDAAGSVARRPSSAYGETVRLLGDLPRTSAGLSVEVPDVVIERNGQPMRIKGGIVPFASPKKGFQVTETLDLLAGFYQNLRYPITRAHLVGLLNGTALTRNVDYGVDTGVGTILGIASSANATARVNVQYTADAIRVDTIYADPLVGGLAVVQGGPTDGRGGDAMMFVPDLPAGTIPIARVLVTPSNGLEIVPLYGWNGFAKRGEEGQHAEWILRTQRQTRRFWQRCRAGAAHIVSYGHSIPAQGSGYPSADNPDSFYTPNGVNRDTQDYYKYSGYAAADLDTIAPKDADGHVRIGYNHVFMRAIKKAFGFTPTYDNRSIGGTNSNNALRNGVPDGLYPQRIAALKSKPADLVLIDFLMGEIGSDYTYSNHLQLIDHVRDMGAEPLVIGLPLIHKIGFRGKILDQWRRTQDECARACEDRDAAFVPFARWEDPNDLGALGMPYGLASGVNRWNHPCPYQLRKEGEIMSEIIPA